MVWCKIEHIEDSNINSSQIVYFSYFGKQVSAIVSKKVLKYLKIEDVHLFKEVFAVKTFNSSDKVLYVIKKVR